ncbi:MAG: HIT domain-containing protein [Candidatus Gracilibacteria bacterium]|nr:HIT domain-containing protein [Candidatus Gracilibacteria bacterium]
MTDCSFCKIARGEALGWIVYENTSVVALFPKDMEVRGHTLVIPKEHYADLYDIPEEILSELIRVSKKLSLAYREKIGATGMNILHASGTDAQQSKKHFHFHLLPRFKDDGLDTWPKLPEIQVDKDVLFAQLKGE